MGKKKTQKKVDHNKHVDNNAKALLTREHTRKKYDASDDAESTKVDINLFPSSLLDNDPVRENGTSSLLLSQMSRTCSANDSYYSKRVVTALLDDQIWTVSNFLSSEECRNWIEYVEQKNEEVELIQQRGSRYLASRECHRYSKNDSIMSQRIFDRIRTQTNVLDVVHATFGYNGGHCTCTDNQEQNHQQPIIIGCNPNIRLYKYTRGMSFGKHIDESNEVIGMGMTRLTILIYLSSCTGGATRFFISSNNRSSSTSSSCNGSNSCINKKKRNNNEDVDEIAYDPVPGSMLLHIHGNECLLHCADPVESGIKYVLRTDLVYGIP